MFADQRAAERIESGTLELQLIPVIGAVAARGFGLADGLEPNAHFLAEAFEIGEGEHALHFDVIGLLEMIPILQELSGEVAVVGHEDETGRSVFEIANRIDALWKTAKEIAKSFAALGVGESGDDFGRLVKQQVDRARGGVDGTAGGFDLVFGGIGLAAEFRDGLAVDANLARKDELFGVPTGGDAGTGDDLLKAFEHER